MVNKPRFGNSGFWDWFLELIKLLIKDPRKGYKAVVIALYLLGGIGFYYFVLEKLDWATYDPLGASLVCFFAIVLYLFVLYPLFRVWTKFDRRFT